MANQLGVRYRYAVTNESEAVSESHASPEAIAALPEPLRKALCDRARGLNLTEFEQCLCAVRSLDPGLADVLSALARDFAYSRILALLENDKTDGPDPL
jgi:hypothetical protein